MKLKQLDKYFDIILTRLIEYGPKLVGAIFVLLIGLYFIKTANKAIKKLMLKSNMDASLIPFLAGILDGLFKVLLVISVMSMIGIAITSFIAILGAVGLAVGMALSGTLQNFAGGVMILIFKPFKPGDFIEAQGFIGIVKEIQIFNTILVTIDNRKIIIPNGGLSGSSMINYSALETRRVDITFSTSYNDDIEKSKSVILEAIKTIPYIHHEPEPFVRVIELGENSINIISRVWVNTQDYWNCYHDLIEKVKYAMDKNGISIPFPQQDVHIKDFRQEN